ncbi:hypothetical protein B0H34DRAFT_856073 [Crassisporium funariophilum]|nr:hypothetical protein B0H34DRAFT_856073 [Crassisporium funariophilum]
MAQQFIQLISSATLDKDKLEPSTLHRLQNPKTEPVDISDPDMCLSLNLSLLVTMLWKLHIPLYKWKSNTAVLST